MEAYQEKQNERKRIEDEAALKRDKAERAEYERLKAKFEQTNNVER